VEVVVVVEDDADVVADFFDLHPVAAITTSDNTIMIDRII
jgi:hypothetical protein